MADLNLVVLAGRLTRDPEQRRTQSGSVTNFGIAVDKKWKDAHGEQKKETLFIDCAAFGRMAENIAQYMARGRSILVRGSLRLNSWEDANGNSRSKITVLCEDCQFLDSKPASSPSGNRSQNDEPASRESFP